MSKKNVTFNIEEINVCIHNNEAANTTRGERLDMAIKAKQVLEQIFTNDATRTSIGEAMLQDVVDNITDPEDFKVIATAIITGNKSLLEKGFAAESTKLFVKNLLHDENGDYFIKQKDEKPATEKKQ